MIIRVIKQIRRPTSLSLFRPVTELRLFVSGCLFEEEFAYVVGYVCWKLVSVGLRLSRKPFSLKSTFEFMLHQSKPTINWFLPL